MHAVYFGIKKKIHPCKDKTARVTREYWRDRREVEENWERVKEACDHE